MRVAAFLLLLVCFLNAHTQAPPANAVAPEEPSFDNVYHAGSVPVVTGKLLNVTAAELDSLPITCTLVTPFAEPQVKKIVSVKPDGSFTIPLDYALPNQQIWFGVGDFYGCLFANKGLYVELDMKKIKEQKEVYFNGDGVRYLGKDGPLTTYYNNYILYQKANKARVPGDMYNMMHPSDHVVDSVLPRYNRLFDSLKKIEDEYIAANASPYGWLLENERMSDFYAGICTMYFGKVMDDSIWHIVKRHKAYLVSNSSTDYYRYLYMYLTARPGAYIPTTWKDIATMQGLTVDERKIIDSLQTGEKLQGQYPYTPENSAKWIKQLKARIHAYAFNRNLARNIKMIDSIFLPAKADFLKFQLAQSTDIKEQQEALEKLLGSMKMNWCKALAKSETDKRTAKINEINRTLAGTNSNQSLKGFGKPIIQTSFGASLYKAPSLKALDFLTKLKQSFPGKAIIIDRWATWCAPCLGEMPHSKELQEASKNLPVVFVYLCTLNGSSEDKWKSKVAEIQQPGIHFLIDEKLDDEISSYFSFSGYPGYAFIDKTGKYRPGAIKWMSEIKDEAALADLVNN
ncbi:MAG TPA: TlpA disulfide reductase family protein [Chitinophagaceae bacterium]|nr:TlpA disulfide reductase family protein [Chitinophagaceae bacterium]